MDERQKAAMSPFDRAVWQRLDDGAVETHGLRAAVETFLGRMDQLEKRFAAFSESHEAHLEEQRILTAKTVKSATRRSWWQSLITPAVLIALIATGGTYMVEKVKAEAINQTKNAATATVVDSLPAIKAEAEVKAQDLARAIVDEQERRERQRPMKREADAVVARQK
jgi:hypothetical protein